MISNNLNLSVKRLLILCIITLICLVSVVVAGKDYYKILGVNKSSSKSDIKKKYRELSIKYHPDKNPGDKTAEDKFVDVSEAYEVLSNDEKKGIYDRFGEEGLKQQQGHGGSGFHNPFDIFNQFSGFGSFANMFRHAERKGDDIFAPLPVSLGELYRGAEVTVDINKLIICPVCKGSGGEHPDSSETCSVCHGAGHRVIEKRLGPMIQRIHAHCDKCNGKGKVVKGTCKSCKGAKVRRGARTLTVDVEKGLNSEEAILLEHEADEEPDTKPGDVILIVQETPDEFYTRNGTDLHAIVNISLREALLGFKRNITTLDDRSLWINRDDTTDNGYIAHFKGEGMPVRASRKREEGKDAGDLFVKIKVDIPKSLTAEQRSVIESVFPK